MANEIIIIGAGPIGLWTAIQIKLQNPEIKVILKERHQTYQRLHTLKLDTRLLLVAKKMKMVSFAA